MYEDDHFLGGTLDFVLPKVTLKRWAAHPSCEIFEKNMFWTVS